MAFHPCLLALADTFSYMSTSVYLWSVSTQPFTRMKAVPKLWSKFFLCLSVSFPFLLELEPFTLFHAYLSSLPQSTRVFSCCFPLRNFSCFHSGLICRRAAQRSSFSKNPCLNISIRHFIEKRDSHRVNVGINTQTAPLTSLFPFPVGKNLLDSFWIIVIAVNHHNNIMRQLPRALHTNTPNPFPWHSILSR